LFVSSVCIHCFECTLDSKFTTETHIACYYVVQKFIANFVVSL
jgi:hypothetical protein